MKKICVYTCITGEYDDVKDFTEFKEKNIDYILFTNNKNIKSNFWKVVYIENEGLDNAKLNRKIKILGHDIINNNYDYSIYIDGSITLRKKITDFFNNCCDFDNFDLIGFKHRERDCIYIEGKACLKYMKEDKSKILKELDYIKLNNYPEHNGLMENTIFARNLKSKKVIETCKMWFDMVTKYSSRDQLSFCYCAYKTKLNFKLLDMSVFDNEYFFNVPHKGNNQIDKYRFYFGDDTIIENINYDFDIVNKYIINKNHYQAEVKSPCDTNTIKFVFGKYGIIKINNIRFNNKIINYKIVNGIKLDDGDYYYSEFPSIIIETKIKKNQIINVSFDLEVLNSNEFDKLSCALMNNYNLLKKDNEDLSIMKSNLENKINELINSKSWKITKPIRKISQLLKK